MNIAALHQLYCQHFLVDTDTRTIRKNTLYFALKGAHFNGNTFAEEALTLGAKYAIVDEKRYKTKDNIILVENVLETLQALANYHRKQLTIPIIGLTGSNGKTTTKELMNVVLSKKFKTVATKGNLNNHIGVPLTILSITPNAEMGIIEMGANHQKEIEFLAAICEPDYGYITNFGKAHLEGFGGIEGVIKGKSELYTYLKNNQKTAFVNPDDALQVEKTKELKTIYLDTEHLQFLEVNPFLKIKYKDLEIQSNLIGHYNITNIAAAIATGIYFGVSEIAIQDAIESYVPQNNRSQIIKTAHNEIILDAYNANPTSMKAALDSFASLAKENKVIILGDMFEVGEDSLLEHQAIIDFAASLHFKHCFFVGENFYQTHTNLKKFKTYAELESDLIKKPLKNQSVLIKGSRGMRLERLLKIIS